MQPTAYERLWATLPFRVVVDACVFPRTRGWIGPILDAAKAGYIIPYWSPLIIAESNRVLTWLWLKRRGGDFSEPSWERCSVDFKRMFARLTEVFRVVEDCPTASPPWDEPSDPWDIPIWTAAKRCEAHFIITANLTDGPPPNAEGDQKFEDITFIHPDQFLRGIEAFSDLLETVGLQEGQPNVADVEDRLPLVFRDFLGDLLTREFGPIEE